MSHVPAMQPASDFAPQALAIRHCSGFEELDACVELQIATWGYGDMDVVPRRLFLLAQKIGGQVIGAFDGAFDKDRLAGFAMALPGVDARAAAYLHSHMLAVDPEYRNRGLGAALKLAQRDDALARGLTRMEWTFDPLEIKNAWLNIHKLGAVVSRYTPNFYGVSSSRLQAGLPTDRLRAEWHLASRWVEGERSVATWKTIETIKLPRAVAEWKQQPDAEGQLAELQADIRKRFLRAFERGLAVADFARDDQGNGIYQLTEQHQLAPYLEKTDQPRPL
jgi:predicted GNAT superfamily acetyltransferase